MGGLKDFSGKVSGRPSIIHGAKYARGFTVNPQDLLRLLHDTQPGFAIPKDAQYKGLGIDENGADSLVEFHYESALAPSIHAFAIRPGLLLRLLVDLADGLLPLDSEIEGIEISPRWTPIMLRIKSSHWPPCPQDDKLLPMYHLRYEVDKMLHLYDPAKMMEGSKRIRIN